MARCTRSGLVLPLTPTVRLYGGTDKWHHGYVPAYESHFRHIRHKRNRVLEIGVGGIGGYDSLSPGGSLRVWRDYFARSVIVGLDINAKDVSELGPRVRFVRGDQTNTAALDEVIETLGGTPNVVIDDGSHIAPHAQQTFEYLFDKMECGSIYVIEDTHTSYWPAYGGSTVPQSCTAIGLARNLVDLVQIADPMFDRRPYFPRPEGRSDVARIDIWPGIFFVIKK